jgi:hypothetical protein
VGGHRSSWGFSVAFRLSCYSSVFQS